MSTLLVPPLVLVLLAVLPAWTYSPSGLVSVFLVATGMFLALGGTPALQ